ncbi:FUSC family protein [Kribbella sp. NPDC054772]
MTIADPRHLIHWHRETPVVLPQLIVAALAMAAPIAYGVATDHLAQASYAALGALAHLVSAPTIRRPLSWLAGAQRVAVGVVVTAGAWVGVSLGGRGWWTAVGVVGLAAVAAVVGGLSRWMADVTRRFITFLVMSTGLSSVSAWEVAQWFALGVAWAIVLGLWGSGEVAARPTYWKVWRRRLRSFDAWRYAVQLVPALAIAEAIEVWWHQEKGYWIALAVVIVVRRRGGSLLRATQRCVGTCVGVLIGGALVLWVPPSWAIVAVVTVLAGLRPLLKERNYAAYAILMTPLVVLLMDLGRTPELSTVGYRLIDTVIGCLIAILPTLVLRRRHVA